MKKVLVECYDSLYVYLMGDSRKNELYMAKNIDYFGNQVGYEVMEGLCIVNDFVWISHPNSSFIWQFIFIWFLFKIDLQLK